MMKTKMPKNRLITCHPDGRKLVSSYREDIGTTSLAHPTGRVVITKKPPFRAAFEGIGRTELIWITAATLAGENRFINQLREPVSVLKHSFWLYQFLKKKRLKCADFALIHDSAETTGHDVPRFMKDESIDRKEDAVFAAFDWPDFHFTEKQYRQFKFWDRVSAIAEATLFAGYKWDWITKEREVFGSKEVDEYIEFLQESSLESPSLVNKWVHLVIAICAKAGKGEELPQL